LIEKKYFTSDLIFDKIIIVGRLRRKSAEKPKFFENNIGIETKYSNIITVSISF